MKSNKLFIIFIVLFIILIGIIFVPKLYPDILNYRLIKIYPEGSNWKKISAGNNPPYVAYNSSALANNNVITIGGYNNGKTIAGTYVLNESKIWKKVNNNNITKIMASQLILFKKKLFLIGGWNNIYLNSILVSDDNGKHWKKVQPEKTFTPRGHHSCVVYKGKIWLFGGYTDSETVETNYPHDIWNSIDGINWKYVGNMPQKMHPRYSQRALVFKDRIWFTGGRYDGEKIQSFNDTWTFNGKEWKKIKQLKSYPARFYHSFVVFKDLMWIIGGSDSKSERLNDMWYSKDGEIWLYYRSKDRFAPRLYHNSISLDDSIITFGGWGKYTFYSDTWVFSK